MKCLYTNIQKQKNTLKNVKYEVLLKEENRKIRHFRKAGRVVMNSLVELTNLNIFRD